MTELQVEPYVRRPFVVEAVLITDDNIAQIAKLVGKLKTNEDGKKSISVDRNKVPSIKVVYPGYYMTRLGKHIRCYNPTVFARQFRRMTGEVQEAVMVINMEDKVFVQAQQFQGTKYDTTVDL